MPLRVSRRRAARHLLLFLFALTSGGCGGGGGGGSTTGPTPAIGLTLNQSAASVVQGANTVTTATVTRSGGYTGAVSLSVQGAPSGVTSAVTNLSTAGSTTTATVTITAGAAVPAGSFTLTIRATGSGVSDATAAFALTVTAATPQAYTLAATGAPVNLNQGGSGQATIGITRSGGFAGNVTLTVEGAPAGLTATLNPTATTGTSSTLSLTASAGLAANTYSLTIRGTVAGLSDRTTTVQVIVAAVGGSGSVTLSATTCGLDPVIWVAYQDGAGTWTRVTGVSDVYTFSVASAKGAFAYVVRHSNSVPEITVRFMTRAQLGAAPFDLCPLGPVKQIAGTVAGVAAGQLVTLALGGGFALATSLTPNFTISGVLDGTHDLVAYRSPGFPSTADRIIIHRDLNLPNNGSVGTLDFAAAEAFAPIAGTITVNGYPASEGAQSAMAYLTGASCDVAPLYTAFPGSNAQAAFGLPAAQQRAGDFHLWTAIAATASTSRTVTESFHTFGSRTMTLGSAINPAVTVSGTNYKRHQAVFTLPAEYNLNVLLDVVQENGVPHPVHVSMTPGWIGGSAVTIALPDFGGVTGWQDSWAPAVGSTTRWTVLVNGSNGVGSLCSEGARTLQATASGKL